MTSPDEKAKAIALITQLKERGVLEVMHGAVELLKGKVTDLYAIEFARGVLAASTDYIAALLEKAKPGITSPLGIGDRGASVVIVYHGKDCRYSPSFPHCNCGARGAYEELERLRGVVDSLRRLCDNAETITIESTGVPYTPRMVNASDVIDILEGRAS